MAHKPLANQIKTKMATSPKMEGLKKCVGRMLWCSKQVDKLVACLFQVDFGGVPARLVNYVSKRQPLAIAYLREYLVGC